MKLQRRQFLQLTACGIASAAVSPAAHALAYPTRPARVIVPFAARGPNDIIARLMAQKLSEQFGTQFYVENIVGAAGSLGMGQAAKAAADGHTLLVVPPNLVVNPIMYASVPYDPVRDFDPVTAAVTATIVLAVHPGLPVATVKELVELIKSGRSKYSFASPGTGTPPHLVGEQFRLSLDLDLAHVPFNGGAPAIVSTAAGHTPIAFCSLPPVVGHIKAGTLRALAVTSSTRSHTLPDVPTMAEAGFPGIEGEGWFAFVVPAGTPQHIIALLNREIVRIIALPEIRERNAALGFEPVGNTPEQCAAMFRAESSKWAGIISRAGIKPEH